MKNKLWEKKNTSYMRLNTFSLGFFRLVRDYRKARSIKLPKHLQLILNTRQSAITKMKVS